MGHELKQELRKKLRFNLKELSPEETQRENQIVGKYLCDFLIHCLPLKDFFVGAYAPLPGEIDWTEHFPQPFFRKLCFPALREGAMKFHPCRLEDLVPTQYLGFTLKTPPHSTEEIVPELLLVPSLAMGARGERLGRGKGFYDRYLENYGGLKIALIFSQQLREEIPTESHDIKMDIIIGPQGFYMGRKLPYELNEKIKNLFPVEEIWK